MPPRPQVEPTDDWHQIELVARAPGQRTYELIRPIVLFGQSPGERAAETATLDLGRRRLAARAPTASLRTATAAAEWRGATALLLARRGWRLN